MKKISNYFSHLFQRLLAFLRVRSTGAGLEVSDEVLRLAQFNGKAWQMNAVRLEPGVMERGKIKNREAFVAALVSLRAMVSKGNKGKKMNVVVCMSSLEAYTQVFALPAIKGDDLAQAVELNLRMASPLEEGEAYSGWQVVGRSEATLQTEILSAFVERRAADDLTDALFDAGFVAMATETKALALTRVLREKGAGVDALKPYLFVSVDNSGIDFLIIRNGALYFEYVTRWRDLADEKGEVAVPRFESAFAASLRQVMNFYTQHWPEPLSSVILSPVALGEQSERVIAANAPLPAVRLTLVMGQPISSEWLVALGSSLRGTGLQAKDQEINLLGEGSRDRFHEEQLLGFAGFWRAVIPVTLGILVLTFAGADFFLSTTRMELEARSGSNLGGGQPAEIAELQTAAKDFNRFVALVAAAQAMRQPKDLVFGSLIQVAAANDVTVNHLAFSTFGAPIGLSGGAKAESAVLAFKAALERDARFSAVNLPLTGVQSNGSNNVSFSMTFVFTP